MFEVKINIGGERRDNPNYDAEVKVLTEWSKILSERYSCEFAIESNSSDYTTLKFGVMDFIRLKYGGSKWIKIFIGNQLAKKLVDDPRFAEEKKKSSLYWKSVLTDTDISKYYDVLDNAYNWFKEQQ